MSKNKECKLKILDEVNCVFIGIHPDDIEILNNQFKEAAPNYFFHPKFQLGQWDGYIRYFHLTGKTFVNLLDEVLPYVVKLGYKVSIIDQRKSKNINPKLIDKNFFSHINDSDGNPFELQDHQIELVNSLLKNNGGIGIAGTGAGKSAACAAIMKTYEQEKLKAIIIVPDKNLVLQTSKDLNDFEVDTGIYYADTKELDQTHLCSTWQSLQNNPKIIQNYDVVIMDECHKTKANVISKILNEYGKNIQFRFGVTATLPKEPANLKSIKTALGEVQYEVPAHKLIDKGWLANLHIDIMQLEVNLENEYQTYLNDKEIDLERQNEPTLSYKQFKKGYFSDWNSEKTFLQKDQKRMEWIKNYLEIMKDAEKGNTLCLVNGVNFGKKLASKIEGAHFVHGKDKMKVRQEIYELFDNHDNILVIATAQIASTGLNIKRVFHMCLIDIGRSYIKTIQAIGRSLRKAKDKDFAKVTDICSDLKYSSRHMNERVKYYREAKYPFKKRKVKL